ncbi:MAG TPA: adenylyl-sulfate kinase [Terriglobales bacterium]|nr:adenylyl-sulfate kinase [Terriglobales bacterium]
MNYNLTDMGELNAAAAENAMPMVREADAAYYRSIRELSKAIYRSRAERPIILLSGPSGSGKTTTALLLERFLDDDGCETHTLSMDNYFNTLTGNWKELADRGELDFESPERVDKAFLNEQLRSLEYCEPVELAKFSFKEGCRVPSGRTLARKPGELIIVEGIHALNPDVITLPDSDTLRIYIAVCTGLKDGETTLLPPGVRLLRRLIRDKLYRKRSFADTLSLYAGVERGEKAYISPYTDRATHTVDTFHTYELGVYKTVLKSIADTIPDTPETAALNAMLERVEPVEPDLVPPDSLIREFIGESSLSY